ncbi:MAG: pyridoxamine 5'-phosphate oxidase family protein [Bacteroidales bacterium]|nr:pyridoxamine 5'-phosphate oxidase family protein [Bacteroidales bacterium]
MKVFIARLPFILIAFVLISINVSGQDQSIHQNRDTLILAAREIIQSTHFCALITIEKGQPHVRTMNPFPLEEDMVIWFATSRNSRKVKEIKKKPNVTVYYAIMLTQPVMLLLKALPR